MSGQTSEFTVDGVTVALAFAGHSDVGAVRKVNEDSFIAAPPAFVVADGMGGHAHGDVASRTAVAVFARLFADAETPRPQQVLDAINLANDEILGLSAGDALSGTTLSGVAIVRIEPDDAYRWMAFNVGDSRVYRWDGRTLLQLSVDHSAVQELVDAGAITRAEADVHPERNVVTRALGADPIVDPDVWLLPVSGHQTFLICSDGLTKELGDAEIAEIIVFHAAATARSDTRPQPTLPERLVAAAVSAGGSDNVTVVIVEADFAGARWGVGEETIDRGPMRPSLEETRPRR